MTSEILWFLFGILIGAVAGFFLTRFYVKKEIKNNPPLNETVIYEMMSQMGRKPSKKQVQAVMKKIKNENNMF